MTDPPPLQLIVGDRGHGVVEYALDMASALEAMDGRTQVVLVDDVTHAVNCASAASSAHVHVTDGLIGGSPEAAATNLERLAAVTRLTITGHDLPQASDGTRLARRAAAYTRLFTAARAVAVNSRHEQQLVAEFLPGVARPHAIPLGSRVAAAPLARSQEPVERGPRDLVVLLAGFIYPGKGHAQAIRAAADAAETLRAAGEPVGAVVVRAIGGPSAGHESDVTALRAEAERSGIRFEVTGFLDDAEFARRIVEDGIPLAAHEHVSASRSMLDWVEVGRRPLVVASRYAEEMEALRPGTLALYHGELPARLVAAWRDPAITRLDPGTSLAPSLGDVVEQYREWWEGMAAR
ncbi:MAG: hypothetical protein ABWY26_08860 [Microbacterium sp.]